MDKLPAKVDARFRRLTGLFDTDDEALAAAYHMEAKELARRISSLVKGAVTMNLDKWPAVYDALASLEEYLERA